MLTITNVTQDKVRETNDILYTVQFWKADDYITIYDGGTPIFEGSLLSMLKSKSLRERELL